MSKLKKKSAILFLAGFGLGFTFFFFLYFFQYQLIFLPPTASYGEKPSYAEEVFFETADGVKLNGWYFPAASESDKTVLYFHGNADIVTTCQPYADWFRDQGIGFFDFDYRGYGKSDQRLPRDEAEFLADAEASYNYLVQQKGIRPNRILLWGTSLGGAAAVDVASRFPIAGIVLQSAFASALEMGQKQFPFLPVKLLIRFPLLSDEKIRNVKTPVLILHARDDDTIPFSHGQKLYENANFPKKFIEIQGGHNGSMRQLLETHKQEITAFFDSL